MHLWQDQLLPRVVNVLLASREVGRHRAKALAGLDGTVVEIGFGSGLNVPFYPPEVKEVLAVEPSSVGWRLSAKRVTAAGVPVRQVGLDGEHLPIADASVDAALSTFTLCTIPDPSQALAELRRVLRPGGRLHFLEHGLAPDPVVAGRQHRLNRLERRVAGGCNLDREMDRLIVGAGFEILQMGNEWMRGPAVLKPWNYLYTGVAVNPG